MNTTDTPRIDAPAIPYEPPAIETVLSADDLTREIQYAGQPSSTDFAEI